MMMIPKTELAWAAGFFDGEGCFHTSKPRPSKRGNGLQVNILVAISQADPEVLHRFKSAVQVGQVRGPYERPKGRPIWRYQVQSLWGVQHVYDVLHPYLSSIKQEQGRRALELYSTRPASVTD